MLTDQRIKDNCAEMMHEHLCLCACVTKTKQIFGLSRYSKRVLYEFVLFFYLCLISVILCICLFVAVSAFVFFLFNFVFY